MSCRLCILEMMFCQQLSHFLERSAYTAVGDGKSEAGGEERKEAGES